MDRARCVRCDTHARHRFVSVMAANNETGVVQPIGVLTDVVAASLRRQSYTWTPRRLLVVYPSI
ncbi:hypothetical protein BQ8482_220037 [Mesorhizobium delmotii]|uniref:Uncharacterized protein n=1 Tax=Mesorhizobium delmotii TaxID=1631247 RepID=A0A2P9AL62_9HYPH|nr:hypothetical protein BQ8482_220037 [Mesorhizobium delmotii]